MPIKKAKNSFLALVSGFLLLGLSCQNEVVYFTEGPTVSYLEQSGLSKSSMAYLASSEGFKIVIKELPFNSLEDLALGGVGSDNYALYSPLVPDSVKKGKLVFPPVSDFVPDEDLYKQIVTTLRNPKKIALFFDQNLTSFDLWISAFKSYLEGQKIDYDLYAAQIGVFDQLKALDTTFEAVLVLGEVNDPQLSKLLAEGSRPWVGSFMSPNRVDKNLVAVLSPDYASDFVHILQMLKKNDKGTNSDLKNTRLRLLP